MNSDNHQGSSVWFIPMIGLGRQADLPPCSAGGDDFRQPIERLNQSGGNMVVHRCWAVGTGESQSLFHSFPPQFQLTHICICR